MTNLYREVVFPVVVALCVFVKAEHSVVKPVVPKFCERLCNETTRCRTFVYKASDLSCHLISRKTIQQSLEEVERMYADTNMTCHVSDTKRRSLQLKRLSNTITNRPKKKKKKEECRRKHCKSQKKMKAQNKRSRCVLYRQENITYNPEHNSKILNLPLPLMVKPGMKIVVYGRYMDGEPDSQMSVSRDPNRRSTNVFLWFHVTANWNTPHIAITEGLKTLHFDGDFPISDPSHFTLAMELMPNSTKIYADKVLVRTVKPFLEIPDVHVRRYKQVYYIEVQKTGEGCGEMDKDNR